MSIVVDVNVQRKLDVAHHKCARLCTAAPLFWWAQLAVSASFANIFSCNHAAPNVCKSVLNKWQD